jgi:hypothetical protein
MFILKLKPDRESAHLIIPGISRVLFVIELLRCVELQLGAAQDVVNTSSAPLTSWSWLPTHALELSDRVTFLDRVSFFIHSGVLTQIAY